MNIIYDNKEAMDQSIINTESRSHADVIGYKLPDGGYIIKHNRFGPTGYFKDIPT